MKNLITHTEADQPFDATLFLDFFKFHKVGLEKSQFKIGEPGKIIPHPYVSTPEFLGNLARAKTGELLTITLQRGIYDEFIFYFEKLEDKRWCYMSGQAFIREAA